MHIGSKLLASVACITLLSGCELLLLPVIIPAEIVYLTAVAAVEETKKSKEKQAAAEDEARADEDDADAIYAQAIGTDDPMESWKYHCLAAHKNHPDAQDSIAVHYLLGRDPVKRDLLKAYVWYRLAESNRYEDGRDKSHFLAANMTPSELADGERLVSEWKPNPAECEMDAKLAAD